MIEDEGCVVVSEALSELIESLSLCKKEALRPGALGQSVFFSQAGIKVEGDSVELFIKALSDWDLMADADNGNVPRYPALVEADAGLIEAVEHFNTRKLAFKTAVAEMAVANDKDRQGKLRSLLCKHGLSRAHPLQCWREVKVFRTSAVKTAGFTTSKKSFSSKVLTVMQAISELEKRDALDDDLQKALSNCHSVRWVNPVSPFIRANLSFWGIDGTLSNATFHASLPIVIQKGAWPAKLKFNQPKEGSPDRKGQENSGPHIIPLRFRRDAYLALS